MWWSASTRRRGCRLRPLGSFSLAVFNKREPHNNKQHQQHIPHKDAQACLTSSRPGQGSSVARVASFSPVPHVLHATLLQSFTRWLDGPMPLSPIIPMLPSHATNISSNGPKSLMCLSLRFCNLRTPAIYCTSCAALSRRLISWNILCQRYQHMVLLHEVQVRASNSACLLPTY